MDGRTGLLARVEVGVFGIGNAVGICDIVRMHPRIVAPRPVDVNGPLTLQ